MLERTPAPADVAAAADIAAADVAAAGAVGADASGSTSTAEPETTSTQDRAVVPGAAPTETPTEVQLSELAAAPTDEPAAASVAGPPPRRAPRPTRSARFLTLASLRWMIRHRAITPWYLARYWRFFRFKLANPDAITLGMVFLDKGATISLRPGYARLILGRWIHVGAHTAIRAHEGTLSLGDKCVLGRGDSINCYLDVELGRSVLIADDVYISDFDHKFSDLSVPIKDQGIVTSRVRIEDDVWLATKVTVARGVVIGTGSVVGANAVVSRDLPPFSVAVGAPARVIRDRRTLR